MDARYLEHALPMTARSPSRRAGARWSATIDAGKLQPLLRARYFLAGVLIGAAVCLPVFLAMQ